MIPLMLFVLLLPAFATAIMETDSYNYDPFFDNNNEGIEIESTEDFVVISLILVVLLLILYKGEMTLENIVKINQRRRIKKINKKEIKAKRKDLKKKIK